MPKISFISDSYQGFTHTENQDGILVIEERDYWLFFIFDGVSQSKNPLKGVEAAKTFLKEYHRQYADAEGIHQKKMIRAVEQCIMEQDWSGGLTTYAALSILKTEPEIIFISNLGDSRIYVIEQSNLIQLSHDDTLHPGSNILTKCLGTGRLRVEDFQEERHSLVSNSMLLATDGCYSLIEKNLPAFMASIADQELSRVKSGINQIIDGKNYDDASYIFIRIV